MMKVNETYVNAVFQICCTGANILLNFD